MVRVPAKRFVAWGGDERPLQGGGAAGPFADAYLARYGLGGGALTPASWNARKWIVIGGMSKRDLVASFGELLGVDAGTRLTAGQLRDALRPVSWMI